MNSIVNKNEADALKEMIFKRARERAQTMSDDVQTDVMDLARDSFVSNNNPFSNIVNKEEKAPSESAEPEVGFKQRSSEAFRQVKQKLDVINEQAAAKTIQNNMAEAREALSNKKSFIGALNFLNSQAAVSLMRTRADRFEVMA